MEEDDPLHQGLGGNVLKPLGELGGEEERERRRREANRADPYSTREVLREGQNDKLAELVKLEGSVEKVVRRRTWEVVRRRCGGDIIGSEEWEDALREWNEGKLKA